MAVPKTTKLDIYMDGNVHATHDICQWEDYTSNPICTSFLEWNMYLSFAVRLLETALGRYQKTKKNDVGMGLHV